MHLTKLQRLIEEQDIRTVTVDMFDTVLLRKIHPERWQFLMHAKEATKILRDRTGIVVTPFFFASLRRSLRRTIDRERVLEGYDGESTLEGIFSLLLDHILTIRDLNVAPDVRAEILQLWTREELTLEKRLLRPSRTIIRFLAFLRDRKIPVYFVSDMYLSGDHVRELLAHFGIADLFAGGCTSADLGFTKWSGRLYARMLRGGVIEGFDPHRNVHIGDDGHADVRQAVDFSLFPMRHGTLHHHVYRPLCRMLGCAMWAFHRWKALFRWNGASRALLRRHTRNFGADQRCLFAMGLRALGPTFLSYVSHLHATAEHSGRPIFFPSSEGPFLLHLLERFRGARGQPAYALPAITRIDALRTFAYYALTRTRIRDSYSLLKLFWMGDQEDGVTNLLRSLGISPLEIAGTELALRHFERKELTRTLAQFCDDEDCQHVVLDPLRSAAERVTLELERAGFFATKKSIVADVGWHASVQLLLEQIATFRGVVPDVRGVYLGTTGRTLYDVPKKPNVEGLLFSSLQERAAQSLYLPELWEQFVQRGLAPESVHFRRGIEECFSLWRTLLPCAPEILCQDALPRMERLFQRPTRREIRLLKWMEHNTGLGLSEPQPLVTTRVPLCTVWKLFLFSRREFQKLLKRQPWQPAFLRWYGLGQLRMLFGYRTYLEYYAAYERETCLTDLYEGVKLGFSLTLPEQVLPELVRR